MFTIRSAFKTTAGLEIKPHTRTHKYPDPFWLEREAKKALWTISRRDRFAKALTQNPRQSAQPQVSQAERKPSCKFHWETCLAIASPELINSPAKQFQLSHSCRPVLAFPSPASPPFPAERSMLSAQATKHAAEIQANEQR